MVRKSADNILILLSCFLMIFSLYQLYFRAYLLEGGRDRINIAELVSPIQTVKFKEKSSFSWKDARQGLGLATGDRVYTHKDSVARINFTKGLKVSMDPNTLLEIQNTGDALGLNIKSGNISTTFNNKTDNITLLIGKKKLTLGPQERGTKLRITKDKTSTKIAVLSGSINIQHKDLEKGREYSKKLEKAEIQIGSNSDIDQSIVTKLPIQFIKTPPRLIKDFPQRPQEIRWEGASSKSDYTFILETPNGSKRRIKARANFIKVIPKAPGLYHYQVVESSKTSQGPHSPQLSFLYQPFIPPNYSILNKVSNELAKQKIIIDLEQRPYKQTALLTNSEGQEIQKWQINPIKNKSAVITLTIAKELSRDKTYFLNIRAEDTQQKSFSLIKKISTYEKVTLAAPVVENKPKITIYTYDKEVQTLLVWQTPSNKAQFEIEVEKDGQKKSYISSKKEFLLSLEPKDSTITWRVRQISEHEISPWSARNNLIVQNIDTSSHSPTQGTELFLDKPNQLVEFKWIAKSKAKYRFELSRDQSFSQKLVSKSTASSTMKLPIGDKGQYYWKVIIIDKNGDATEQGRPIQIKITPSPAPKPLKLRERIEIRIKSKKSLDRSTRIIERIFNLFISSAHASDSSASLTWQADPLAKSYIIRVYAEAQDSKSIIERKIKENSFEWLNPKPGTYYWDVSIVDFWDREGEPSNRAQLILTEEIVVKQKKYKSSPAVISLSLPAHKSKLSAKEESFSFTIPQIEAKNLFLQFSKDLDFANPKVEIKLKPKLGNYTVRLRRSAFTKSLGIEENESFELYWRVTTKNQGKSQDNKSLRRFFTWDYSEAQSIRTKVTRTSKKTNPTVVFQEYSSATIEQSAPAFNVKAKGFFVNSVGIKKELNFFYPSFISLKAGTAKAFQTLRYNSGQLKGITRPQKLQFKKWKIGLGASLNYQTFFKELSNLSLAEDQTLLPLAHIEVIREIFKEINLALEVAGGSGFKYRASANKTIGKIFNREASLGFHYEGLNFQEGAIDIDRKSFGVNWTLAVSP